MSEFYYHGINMSSDDEKPYNRAIVRLNELNDYVKNEAGIKKLMNNATPFKIISSYIFYGDYALVLEESNEAWTAGVYNMSAKAFEDVTVEDICGIDEEIVSDFSRNFQRYSSAILRGEVQNEYSDLSPSILDKWNQYKEDIADENINTLSQADLTDGVKTDYDLEKAIRRIREKQKSVIINDFVHQKNGLEQEISL